ncbi:VOC family protein [Salirhabdus sp. Marseille-P4669]|uniref:VOC family protein n=1 Tax=Salirhabdus sp. Marseille-P4669 TaxID=2042310 RepID=UPI000C7BDDC3|nr:VOC family protein [Salirhabdus sp. Marseille-P4669]
MLAFDHLVIYSSNIQDSIEAFQKEYNQFVLPGGHHENWGTYNYIAYMHNNSYIEWLGIEDIKRAEASDNPLIQQTANAYYSNLEGPIQFAFRTTDMDRFIHYYQNQRIKFNGPYPGSRKRPDGSIMKWRMLFPVDDSFDGILPFLIEWEGDGNRPNDRSKINQTTFSKIRIGTKQIKNSTSVFKRLYMLKDDPRHTEPEWQVENGSIHLVQNISLEARFEHISLKR